MKLNCKNIIAITMLFTACDNKIDVDLISTGTNMSEEQKIIEQNLDIKSYEEIKDITKDNKEIALNKNTIIIFGRNGCIYCDELKKDIKNSEDIKNFIKNNFELYYINSSYSKIHNINDKQIKTQDLTIALNVIQTPTIIFFDKSSNVKYVYPGYTNKFKELLQEVNNIPYSKDYKIVNDSLKEILG